MVTDDQAF